MMHFANKEENMSGYGQTQKIEKSRTKKQANEEMDNTKVCK
jgi:hypothetical protein